MNKYVRICTLPFVIAGILSNHLLSQSIRWLQSGTAPYGVSTVLAVTLDQGILRSTNSGVEWDEINSGLPYKTRSGLRYISVDDLVTDSGTTWTAVALSLGTYLFASFTATQNGFAFAGTVGGNIYGISVDR